MEQFVHGSRVNRDKQIQGFRLTMKLIINILIVFPAIALSAIALPTTANAHVEKLAIPTDSGVKFYWWPTLPKVKGWHHDRDYSILYSCNAQAPNGYNFANAETVIYARAIFKPAQPKLKSLKDLIEKDQFEIQLSEKNVKISEAKPVVTGDGKNYKSFTYIPSGKGNWEKVSYGEEGKFYVIFTISSHSQKGFKKSLKVYERLISHYKEKP